MFALISDDQLYLKADATTVPDFEGEGLGPFTYEMKTGTRSLPSYWRAPERLLDDDDEMLVWCRRAAEVATRAAKKKSASKSSVKRSPAGARSRRSRARQSD
jgi:DNA transformation protein